MKKLLAALAALVFSSSALAQVTTPGVRQSGAVTLNHIALFANTTTGGGGGAIKDGGVVSNIFSAITNCNLQGSIIYVGAGSAIKCLDPTGQNGKFVKSNDVGADPSFAVAAGAGTVTSQGATSTGSTITITATAGANPNTSAATFNFELRNSGALSIIGRAANTAGAPADISAVAASSCAFRESASTLGCGTLATAAYANSSVTYAKIQNVTDARLLGNATGAGAAPSEISVDATLTLGTSTLGRAALTGDVTASAASNATAIAANAVTTAKILAANVTYAKIQNVGALALFGNATNSATVGADVAAVAASGCIYRESASTLGCGNITGASITANTVANAALANMAQSTIKGRASGAGAGVPTDLTWTQVAAMSTTMTTSHVTNLLHTGGFGANGSGTYTTPAGVRTLVIQMVGAGGGGGGSGTTPGNGGTGGNTCWNTTGAACTTPVYQTSGGTGGGGSASTASSGGTVAGSATCNFSTQGGGGAIGPLGLAGSYGGIGGQGGASYYGGGGTGGFQAANGNTTAVPGGGGGGAGAPAATANSGTGGAAGAFCRAIIAAPAATYTYACGVAGTQGAAGTSGGTGALGADCDIYVEELYQ